MDRTDEELRTKVHELELRDAEQRNAVSSYGIDLGKERTIDLTFWAPDESKAKFLAQALVHNEMIPQFVLGPANRNEPNQRWVVRAPIRASVNFVTTKENLITFLLFADKYECEYDGWGTAIVEAAQQPPNA